MNAVNFIGLARVASLVAALEKMPQLTSLNLACARIGLRSRARLERGGLWLFGVALVVCV
jgi:hypothetical protein